MKKLLPFIASFLLLSPAFGQSANDLFQQALVMERSEGDLLESIKLYERVISTSADRSLSAKALIRIGDNYERLGHSLARQTYQRVLDDYSEQHETAEIARNRLAYLLASIEGDSDELSRNVINRHVMDIPDNMGKVSPDGRYLSFVDWKSGNVGILDLESGEQTLVNSDGLWGRKVNAFGDVSMWSPDGRELLYLWLTQEGGNDTEEIRIYSVETGQTRILVEHRSEGIPFPIKWYDDGKKLLAINKLDGHLTDAITIVDAVTGETETVTTLSENWHTFGMDISPDMKHIVFESFASGQRRNRTAPASIKIMSTAGAGVMTVVDNITGTRSPIWDSQGENILYITDHNGHPGLWSQEFVSNQPHGAPKLVYNGFDGYITPHGISKDGRYFYSLASREIDMFTESVDFTTGEIHPNLRIVSSTNLDIQRSGSFSPNGKNLALVATDRAGKSDLMVTHIESGETLVHELPFGELQIPMEHPLIWSPDNSSLLIQSSRVGRQVIISVNTDRASHVEIDGLDEFDINHPQQLRGKGYTADGSKIVIAGARYLVEVDLEKQSKRVIREFKNQQVASMAVSPDGTKIAVVLSAGTAASEIHPTIALVAIEDGKTSVVDEIRSEMTYSRFIGITWTPDGHGLVFGENRPNSGQQLYHLTLDTGRRIALGEEVFDDDQRAAVTVHPDGDKLTFSKGSSSLQLWALEGIEF